MIQMLLKKRDKEGVHLIFSLVSDSNRTCLVVYHLPENSSFVLGNARTIRFNMEVLRERESWHLVRHPFKISHCHC